MSSVFHRNPRAGYPLAVSAQGLTITDAQGRSYLDMSGGAVVSCLGHGHPAVVAAVREQVGRMAFAHTAFFTNEPQEQLAALLAQRFGDPGARVYFTSGGSEANETALKLCWQYWAARGQPQKKVVISREHSYHGNTLGALSVSGNPARRRASAAPLLDWPRIAPCYPFRDRRADETLDAYALRVADELEAAILAAGPDKVAAFICEPVVGASLGAVAAAPGYLARIRAICDRHDVLWIADEVMCGGGRTGDWFACAHDNVSPDLATLGKGVGGGYQPLAATVLSPRVVTVLEAAGFAHGHTYVGHPVACAAGLAVQQVIEREGLLARAREMGGRFSALLRERFGGHPKVADIRGRGLLLGMELTADRGTLAGFDAGNAMTGQLIRMAMDAGLICYPGGISLGGKWVPHLLLAPALTVEAAQLEECCDRLAVVLDLLPAA